MFSGVLSGAISATIHHKNHNLYCGNIVEEGSLFLDLDMVAQDAVLSCQHPSHKSVQMLFRTYCDTKITEQPPEGRLF